jgi:hypothetical protein
LSTPVILPEGVALQLLTSVHQLELELELEAASSLVSSFSFAQELIVTIMQPIMANKKYVLLILLLNFRFIRRLKNQANIFYPEDSSSGVN